MLSSTSGYPTGSIIDQRKLGMMELLKTYRHTEYYTLDKIDPRSLREAVVIGAISGYGMANEGDWPEHRTSEEVEEIRKIARI